MVEQTGRKNGLECSNALYKHLKKLISGWNVINLKQNVKRSGRAGKSISLIG